MGVLVCWLLIVISSQWRGWWYGPQKLFKIVYYADILLFCDCGHSYAYGGGIELGLS